MSEILSNEEIKDSNSDRGVDESTNENSDESSSSTSDEEGNSVLWVPTLG